jgi:LmbE family N-acetylglucosaminyl deacetylase
MTKNILVIAAHTDDEALGCGGTIARHVAQGDDVYAVFIADGVSSRDHADQQKHLERNSAAQNAHAILGIKKTYNFNYPDNQLDSLPLLQIIKKIEQVIQEISPNIVFTHHRGDLNVDHQICHQAALTACRPIPGSPVEEIYSFEVVSSTDWNQNDDRPFTPNVYIDISDFLETKIRALAAYGSEICEFPHSRSMEHVNALACHRGNSVGYKAAEAFMAVRIRR